MFEYDGKGSGQRRWFIGDNFDADNQENGVLVAHTFEVQLPSIVFSGVGSTGRRASSSPVIDDTDGMGDPVSLT